MAPPSTMPATTTTDAATSEGGGGEAFDRRRPLFDGTLSVEVVSSGSSGASSREGQQLTVRVLRGARGQHGGERVLRLEVGERGWSVFWRGGDDGVVWPFVVGWSGLGMDDRIIGLTAPIPHTYT